MTKNPKFVVVHAGARDRYQLPLAFAEADLLQSFVTDAYRSRGLIGSLVSSVPQFGSRFHPRLSAAHVVNDPTAFAASVVERFAAKLPRSDRLHHTAQYCKDRALSKRAARETLESDATLFSTSYYAGPAFSELEKHGRSGLLFQIHPDPNALRKLFVEEIELQPLARASLMAEKEMLLGEYRLDELAMEAKLARRVLVASSFTRDSLIAEGIAEDKIEVCPYGVDFDRYKIREFSAISAGPLRIAFVGSVIQRKGLTYLLEAVSRFPANCVELTFYTRAVIDAAVLARYTGPNIFVKERLSDIRIVEELHRSDLFALPSIAEGFAHSIAEAMAVGLPVIASVNTMARDCVEDNVDGFLVPIRSADAIEEKIAWAIDNRESLADMGKVAAAKIRQYSWERFREGVRKFALAD